MRPAYAVNFRNTSGFVTDGPEETYCLPADTFPTSRAGMIFGWVSGSPDARNRSSSIDRRLAGMGFVFNSGGVPLVWRVRVDPGPYDLTLAIGDAGADQTAGWAYNAYPGLTRTNAFTNPSAQFLDAVGRLLSSSAWPSGYQKLRVVVPAPYFEIALGSLTAGTQATCLAHVRLDRVAVRRVYQIPAGGGGGVSGEASITLAALTSSAAGTVDVAGAAAVTLAALTSTAVGTVDVAGAAAVTLGALTSSAAGTVDVTGAATVTLGALTSSAAGAVAVAGTSAVTLGALTSAAAGTVAIAGASTPTLAALTSAAAGAVEVKGAAAVTLGALTVSAEGAVGFVPVQGEASVTLAPVTSAATGTVLVNGLLAKTLDAATLAAMGAVAVSGLGGGTFATLGLVAAGIVTNAVPTIETIEVELAGNAAPRTLTGHAGTAVFAGPPRATLYGGH